MSREFLIGKVKSLGVVFLLFAATIIPLSLISFEVGGDAPFSSNVQVNIDVLGEPQNNPSIAAGGNGDLYVVWEDYISTSDFDIYFANSSDWGATWRNPNVQINTDASGEDQSKPVIAVDSSGNLFAVWEDSRNGGSDVDIYFANSTDGGSTWSDPNVRINDDASGMPQTSPAIAVDSAGTVYVVWEDFRNAPDFDIYLAKSTDGGATWTNPNINVSDNAPAATHQVQPTIAVDSSNDIYVAWQDNRDGDWNIYFSKSGDGGTTWSNPDVRVNTDAGTETQSFPSIAVNSTGEICLAWQDHRNSDADIYFANSTDGGATWTDPNVKVNTDSGGSGQTTPSLGIDPSGTLFLAWGDSRDDVSDVFFAKSTNGGLNWSDPNLRVNDDPGSENQRRPCLAVGGNDTVYIAWEDYRNTLDYEIYFASLLPPPTVDRVIVSLSPVASSGWTGDRSYGITGSEEFYACGWNDTYNVFVELVDADWFSDDPGVGTVAPSYATSTIFTAVGAGTCKVRAENTTYGLNWTGVLSVIDYQIDYMFISRSSGGATGWIGDRTYSKYDTDTFYAVGWNQTANVFAGLVEANWTSTDDTVGDVSTPGTSTAFSALDLGTCKVTAENATYGTNDTGILTVGPLGIDGILISEIWDGISGWFGDMSYPKNDLDVMWACAWNYTYDEFVEQAVVTWTSDDPSVGTVDPGPSTTTQFNAVGVGTCRVMADGGIYGTNDTGILTVNPLGIDRIIISQSPNASSGWIGDQLYVKHDVDTFYACGWNDTENEFVVRVDATWVSDDEGVGQVISPGNFTSFTAAGPGSCRITATTIYGSNETGLLTVDPLGIDRFFISLAPNGSTDWIDVGTYSEKETDTLYACGWNNTYDEFVSLLDVTWDSTDEAVGNVSASGTSTLFTAVGAGICTITATYVPLGANETGELTVLPLEIDRIVISLSNDGSTGWIGDQFYVVGGTETLYSLGWNDTFDEFVEPVDCDWESNNTAVGILSISFGNYTNFAAISVGSCRISATNSTYTEDNETGVFTVSGYGIDRILISLSPNGITGWIGDRNYVASDTATYYACGWNDTFDKFVTLVEVDWVSNNTGVGDVTPQGKSTTFTVMGPGTCIVTATNSTIGSNQTGVLTVSIYTIDRIFISLFGDGSGGWIGDITYFKHQIPTFYAVGWNDTANLFVKQVEVDWESNDESVGEVTPTGMSTTFTAVGEGICAVTADHATYGSNVTGVITILALEIDDIIISASSDGSLGWMGDAIYIVYDTDSFYAIGWNTTYSEFTGLVNSSWESSDIGVGSVTTPGLWTNFTAKMTSADATCAITATFGSISNTTGILTVLAPTIDEIIIRSAPDEGGEIIVTATFSAGHSATYHAAGYNDTAGYVMDISGAQWSISGGIGSATTPGSSTLFLAENSGTGTIEVSFGDITNTTGEITVVDIIMDPLPDPPTLSHIGKNSIRISWVDSTDPDVVGHRVYRRESPEDPWELIATVGVNVSTYLDEGLKSGTTYYYSITTIDDADPPNESEHSPVAFAKTDSEAADGGFPLVILIIIIAFIVVILLLFIFTRSKKPEGEVPYEKPPESVGEEEPQEPEGIEEHGTEEGYGDMNEPDQEYEEDDAT